MADGENGNKYIGGAERARREARNRRWKQKGESFQASAGGRDKKKRKYDHRNYCSSRSLLLPKSIKPSERFFASLFMSSFAEIKRSNELDCLRHKVMNEACARAGLPLPSHLPPTYKNAREYYSMRAPLVLEEARCILSDALLSSRKRRRQQRETRPLSVPVKLVSMEKREKTGFVVLSFEKSTAPFTPKEMYNIRPGSCFQIVPPPAVVGNKSSWDESSLLGSTMPHQSNPEQNEKFNSLALMVYRKEDALFTEILEKEEEEGWTVIPVVTLISQVRQFEACSRAKKVAFLPKLLAWKDSTHTRFVDSDDDSEDSNEIIEITAPTSDSDEGVGTDADTDLFQNTFRLPSLNRTQNQAANEFLESQESALTLVQGPPGTGKTTFMVSVIAKSLLQSSQRGGEPRRILVTAPTNKAIAVLATRFLDAIGDNTCFNVAMIGVQDKLVSDTEELAGTVSRGDDPFAISSLSSTLRQIFVYTWVESIVRDFETLRNSLYSRPTGETDIIRARQLQEKLIRTVPSTAKSVGATNMVKQFVQSLEDEVYYSSEANDADKTEASVLRISLLNQLITVLASMGQAAVTAEILATADVIFCTLSTSGVSAMKRTRRIDDLFIDEAAAATEPEICIPFHLGPTRMLAVGDPKQLPAMVVSKHAAAMGLAKSMHERLMFDCRKEHIMLDVQYRMNPSISLFPSNHFYAGKLCNGYNVTRPDYVADTNILGGKSYSFIQLSGQEQQEIGGSFSNAGEAAATVALVKMVHKSSMLRKPGTKAGSTPWHGPDKIRIITFYQGQVTLIRRMLNKAGLGQVLVATVDSSQGCEADLVIVSFVRSNTGIGNLRRAAGFLTDDRRMNVALTRARYQLVCIGNARGTLTQSGASTLRKIVHDAEERNCLSDSGFPAKHARVGI